MTTNPLSRVLAIAAALLTAPVSAVSQDRVLRVCADPNNLPFSNQSAEGFENRIVELVAKDMGAKLEYVWWAQRRGFSRNTLEADSCDVWPGVSSELERLGTTRPYYRSIYVFVSRIDRGLEIDSLDDPRLKDLVIGVQLIGDDGANTPPAHALARRGHTENIRGYMIYGNYRDSNPPRRIVDAVADGSVDVAVAWGPMAGFFAQKSAVPLKVTAVEARSGEPELPMAYDISMGVRKNDDALRAELDRILTARRSEIRNILVEYGVPLVER